MTHTIKYISWLVPFFIIAPFVVMAAQWGVGTDDEYQWSVNLSIPESHGFQTACVANCSNCSDQFVNITGDNMTGPLLITDAPLTLWSSYFYSPTIFRLVHPRYNFSIFPDEDILIFGMGDGAFGEQYFELAPPQFGNRVLFWKNLDSLMNISAVNFVGNGSALFDVNVSGVSGDNASFNESYMLEYTHNYTALQNFYKIAAIPTDEYGVVPRLNIETPVHFQSPTYKPVAIWLHVNETNNNWEGHPAAGDYDYTNLGQIEPPVANTTYHDTLYIAFTTNEIEYFSWYNIPLGSDLPAHTIEFYASNPFGDTENVWWTSDIDTKIDFNNDGLYDASNRTPQLDTFGASSWSARTYDQIGITIPDGATDPGAVYWIRMNGTISGAPDITPKISDLKGLTTGEILSFYETSNSTEPMGGLNIDNILRVGNLNLTQITTESQAAGAMFVCRAVDGHLFVNDTGC